MKSKKTLLLTLISISQLTYFQSTKKSKAENDFIYAMKFELIKDIFKKPEYSYKSQKLDLDKILQKSNKSKTTIISSIKIP